jgi:hypothetical protein
MNKTKDFKAYIKMRIRFRSVVNNTIMLLLVGSAMGLMGIAMSATTLHAQAENAQTEHAQTEQTQAKLVIPPITWSHDPRREVTAQEAEFHVALKERQLDAGISYHAEYPKDSLLQVVATHAEQWLTEIEKRPIKGLQHDPAGRVSVAAKHEQTAQEQFAKRLATPGLSLADRAYTYSMAVAAFSNWRFPDLLPIAEEYLTALTKLGPAAAPYQLRARAHLVGTYQMLGRSDAVLRHGMRAMRLLPTMAYADQWDGFTVAGQLLDAISGMPDAQAKLDTIGAYLQATIHPPAVMLVQDSMEVVTAEGKRQSGYEKWIKNRELLGQLGKPFVAQYWVNRASSDSALIPVNDGKIRIVQIFDYSCAGCVGAVSSLERIKHRNPFVEVMALTWTFGTWGNRIMEMSEEAKLVGEKFVTANKYTLPIGIWYSKREANEVGGSNIREFTGGNFDNYPTASKSMFFIFDGKGRIRRITPDGSLDGEIQMERTVQFLQKEAAAMAVTRNSTTSVTPDER